MSLMSVIPPFFGVNFALFNIYIYLFCSSCEPNCFLLMVLIDTHDLRFHIYLSIYLSICIYLYLSIYLSICIYLSIFLVLVVNRTVLCRVCSSTPTISDSIGFHSFHSHTSLRAQSSPGTTHTRSDR